MGTHSEAIMAAVTQVLANPHDIPNLSVSSVNINGRSFFLPTSVGPNPLNLPNNSGTNSNTGMIVGLVVGLVLAAALVVALIVIFLYVRSRHHAMPPSEDPEETVAQPSGNYDPHQLLPIVVPLSPIYRQSGRPTPRTAPQLDLIAPDDMDFQVL